MISAPLVAQSQVLKIDLEKDLKSSKVTDLYAAGTDKSFAKLAPLSRLKYFETRSKWSDCLKLAPQVFSSHKDLQGWIALSWLNCAEKDRAKNSAIESTTKALSAVTKALREEGPWSKDLDQAWINAKYAQVDSLSQKKGAAAATHASTLLEESSKLSREQRAFLFRVLGDEALQKKDYKEARFFFEESKDQKSSSYVDDKINFLVKAMGGEVKSPPAIASETDLSEQGKIQERIRTALKQNDVIVALKDIILLLNDYSGSSVAKQYRDKPLEIYNAVVESGKSKVLDQMEDADAAVLLDWAQSLHRRADFKASLQLAEKSISKNPTSPQIVSALWVAGRSAHFLGDYPKAQGFYRKLIDNHSGSDESAEALFRSGLIYFRTKDYGSAGAQLEKLLVQKRDRYELNAQYWLIRALEQTSPERAKTQTANLIERFPFSYYGLRLAAEQNSGKVTWPTPKTDLPKLDSTVYFAGDQVKAWKRFVALSGAGWLTEAQRELSSRPYLWDPTLNISFAKKMADRKQFSLAIRLINSAMESDTNLRREEFLKIGFPNAYESLFSQEGARYGLDPVLLKSLTRQESAFNLRALSSSNAMGLMQMIPPTAREVAGKLSLKIEIPEDMYRPEINIPMGSFYISQVLNQFDGNVPMGLAAYNAGPYRLNIWLDSRPETSALRKKVSGAVEDEIWFDELPWNESSFYIKAILRNVMLYRLIEKGPYDFGSVAWSDLLNKKAK